ncbi:Glu/Leu/Phe/Val dehydrogenase dimerization domain-containing protein [Methanococcoides burtonii]|uniref:Glu/Leu/Phe/Val dehydrogenase dimerization domain-containing protein n=1 Tax=Methanococcoides burtonii TaxID=29291 RepID=UPI0022B2A255|nr:Glu/Leu/Phe/Val dehydrogenase dimerization domain-containing protein [Methanococcoides burtonii]
MDTPRHSFSVHFPVRMNSGKTKIFIGHRVQYNDARGPTKVKKYSTALWGVYILEAVLTKL